MPPQPPLQWAAQVAPVQEVTLLGSADLAFWQEHLRPAALWPAVADGRAQIMLCAAAARFHGIPFRELSISVLISRQPNDPSVAGAYLVHAFNSLRLFAWFERTLFATPYFPAAVNVQVDPPSLSAAERNRLLLQGILGLNARVPLRAGDEEFAGPVFLPSLRHGASRTEKFFVARLSGPTRVYAFDSIHDSLLIEPAGGPPVLQWLIDSGLTGHQWQIRAAGRHAKSKTYRRTARDPWAR